MIRITIIEIASFLLPFLIFFIWRWQANTDAPIKPTPTLRLAAIGAGLSVLVLVSLVLLESSQGGHEGELYVPSRMVDGQVVPGYFIPVEETAAATEPETGDVTDPQ
ncbi:DUF6111 family protein [uncultured Maricaulis sp.]|uniref:DUF6111 family protein n=1 Tax=uncultured Maricaulis sp. TaxID=174710 RepID=UPI0030D7E6FF|tara:strand:+ start:33668 stop:33988 length:321 start_codon:yes stop_codon:yes gene_type:complete